MPFIYFLRLSIKSLQIEFEQYTLFFIIIYSHRRSESVSIHLIQNKVLTLNKNELKVQVVQKVTTHIEASYLQNYNL